MSCPVHFGRHSLISPAPAKSAAALSLLMTARRQPWQNSRPSLGGKDVLDGANCGSQPRAHYILSTAGRPDCPVPRCWAPRLSSAALLGAPTVQCRAAGHFRLFSDALLGPLTGRYKAVTASYRHHPTTTTSPCAPSGLGQSAVRLAQILH